MKGRPRIPLTPSQLSRARELRATGMTWGLIARNVDTSYDRVRLALDPEWGAMRAANARGTRGEVNARVDRRSAGLNLVPDSVIQDRTVREAAPRSLTSLMCGDPAPGYSALDKKRSGASA